MFVAKARFGTAASLVYRLTPRRDDHRIHCRIMPAVPFAIVGTSYPENRERVSEFTVPWLSKSSAQRGNFVSRLLLPIVSKSSMVLLTGS